jgi:hypothetical protein
MKLRIILLLMLGQCAVGAPVTRSASDSVTLRYYPHMLLAQSPTPTPDPPKPSVVSEQDLLGTWLHVGTSETLGGKQKEMAPMEIKWKLESGGRGTFSQRISVSAAPWVSQLGWGLDGTTIMLDGGRNRYTIVRPGTDSMVWKNEAVGNYYHVRRLP